MQLINELLTPSFEDRVLFLFEDLGKLKVIDPDLVKAMTKRSVGPGFGASKKHGDVALGGIVGRGSEVIEEPMSNLKAAWKGFEDDKSKLAFVVKYDGDQVLIVADPFRLGEKKGYKDDQVYVVRSKGINADTWSKVLPKESSFFLKDLAGGEGQKLSASNVKKMLELLFKQAKDEKVDVSLMFVKPDVERSEKGRSRSETRQGRIPLPREGELGGRETVYNKFLQRLKNDLRTRLDKFKSTNVKDRYGSNEELVKGITERGFPPKINFMGYTYDKYRTRTNIDELLAGRPQDPNYPHFSITYKLNTSAPEIEELKVKLNDLRNEMKLGSTPEEREKMHELYYERRRELSPPGEIEIVMGMKGGSFVPADVRISDREVWI